MKDQKKKETIPFTFASKRIIKHLGINVPTKAKDLYSETNKMLMKERGDTNRWKDITMFLDWRNEYCQN